jgi:hypothetical protein
MAEKELFSELTDSCGTGPAELEPEPEDELDVPLLPQAARTRAALATIAAAAAVFVTECNKTTSLMDGTWPMDGTCRNRPQPPTVTGLRRDRSRLSQDR